MNNAVLWDQPGLRKTNWLESLEVIWPDFADLHVEHARCAQAVLDAQAARSASAGKFAAEDRARVAALAAGEKEGKVTSEADRRDAFHELELKAEGAELALANVCERVINEIRDREDELVAGLDGVETRARARQSAARAELEAAERQVLALQPARFWLKRTVDGISHIPFPDFGVPSPDVLMTVGEFAGRLSS